MDSIDRPIFAGNDEAGDSQRERHRDSMFLMGALSLTGEAATHDVKVRNLSKGGLMIEFDRPISVGTTLTLAMRGIGDVTGQVAWCTEGRIGIALDRQINPRLARKSVGGGAKTPGYAKPWISRA